MIEFKVVSVARHLSSEVDTSYLDWKDNDVARKKKIGGEWEEITLKLPIENKPTLQVGNIIGNVAIEGAENYIKLRLHDPKLFGTFKVGDTASLLVLTIPQNTEGKDK